MSHFKNDKEYDEFNKWYESYEGEWVFMDELKKYCKNDVEVLADIMLKYHNVNLEKHGKSPWKFVTASSYFHDACKRSVTRNLELPDPKDEGYAEDIAKKVKDSWAILKTVEYAAAKKALRGGRTGIGRIFCELTPEQIARGCKIKYVDVVSLYPYQQVKHDYPVGLPKIHIFDSAFQPCYKHRNSFEVFCDCDISNRYYGQKDYKKNLLDIEIHDKEWDTETLLQKHGFVMATVQPPQMLHPILVRFDEDEMKCNATCELIVKGCFTTAEFHTALRHGYKVIKLHRVDEYKMAPGLWNDFTKDMYIFKQINSREAPVGEEREKFIKDYEDLFEMGDAFNKTIEAGIWGKNPAKKAAAKTGLNSGWGRHAQRLVMTISEVIDWNNSISRRRGDALFKGIMDGNITYQQGTHMSEDQYMYQYKKDGELVQHDLSNSYLPAACFVPAYGRMQLWEQLNKLGDRVLMYDTDSVVYIYDPEQYNVPQGKLWGQWEEEEISEVGITGFVGLGPKSYAMRCKDESMNVVKLKGISQKRCTEHLLNYESLKAMVMKNLETRELQQKAVPQEPFVYKMTQGMFTVRSLKYLSFDYKDQKGMVGKNFFMYPKGYTGSDYIPI